MKTLLSISLILGSFSLTQAQSGTIKVRKHKIEELQLVMREGKRGEVKSDAEMASGNRHGLKANCRINKREFPLHALIGSGYRGTNWTSTAGVSFFNTSQVSSVNLRWEYQSKLKLHMVFAGYQYAMLKPGRKITPHSVLSVGLDVGTRLSGAAYIEFKPYLAYSVRAYSSLLNRFQLNLGYAMQTGRQTENLSISNGPELALWFYL